MCIVHGLIIFASNGIDLATKHNLKDNIGFTANGPKIYVLLVIAEASLSGTSCGGTKVTWYGSRPVCDVLQHKISASSPAHVQCHKML